MFLRDLALVVLVAAVAGVGRVAVEMAGRTGTSSATVIQREAVRSIKGSRAPGAGRMA